jgi:hypothetical protein
MTEALLAIAGGSGLCQSSSTDGKAGARMMTGFIRLTSISQNGKKIVLVGTDL